MTSETPKAESIPEPSKARRRQRAYLKARLVSVRREAFAADADGQPSSEKDAEASR